MAMAHVGNPPFDDSPECPPENQSSSDYHQPNTNSNNSFSRRNKHSRVMENCIALFLKFGAAASPTKTLSPKLKALIEQRLPESFPVHHRPNHLPYAAMIETAISTLNEKGGSSEEAISDFIRKENHDLPWAHDMFLKHHLENLCKDGSILKTRHGLYTTNTDRVVSTNTDPSISSSTSNSDSDVTVSERLALIKLETKMRRLKRMNKEVDKGQEKNLLLEEYEKVNQIKTKEKMIKKQFTGDLAIVALNGHEDAVYKELNGSGAREEVAGQELAIVALNGHEDMVYNEVNGSGARGEVVGQDQNDSVMRIEMDRQESEAQVKQFDHLIEGKRGITVLKEKPLPEETNQLQEHNVAPIRKQWCVKKKKKKAQLPKRNRKGRKACIVPAGRRRGKHSNDNETTQDELNEDQTLMEALNAIKRSKKGKVMVEERTEHTAHRSRLPKGKEIVIESRMHEAFGAGKGDVVVIGLSRNHEAFGEGKRDVVVRGKDEKQKHDAVVIGLFSSSYTLGTR